MNGATAPSPFILPPDHVLHRVQRGALIAGVFGLGLCGAAGFVSPTQFFRSYLLAYLFWFGIALGSLAILMIHHVTGGAWGAVIRRLLECGTRTMPLLALLFLPVVAGMPHLYEWARPDVVAQDTLLQQKSVYLNVPFFVARAVLYFSVWLIVGRYLNRWSLEQDRTLDARPGRRLELLSRGGLLIVGLTMTFASVDWMMSLEPHWFSTIYGILVMGGQVVTAMAFMIPLAAVLAHQPSGPLANVIAAEQFHDLGKLLMAFIMLWAYFMLSQFLIVWAGNLPEEIPWYIHRAQGGWQWIALVLVFGYFVVPFLILLSRDVKRRPRLLARVAIAIMLAQALDLFWMVTPAFHPEGVSVHWMDLAMLLGVGGIWVWGFIWQLKGRSLVAIHDPSLPELA